MPGASGTRAADPRSKWKWSTKTALQAWASRRLDQSVRPGDTVGRFASDEFVVICEDAEDATDVLRVAERLTSDLGQPTFVDGEPVASIAAFDEYVRTKTRPGSVIRLEVRRGGTLQPVELTLTTPPARAPVAPMPPAKKP